MCALYWLDRRTLLSESLHIQQRKNKQLKSVSLHLLHNHKTPAFALLFYFPTANQLQWSVQQYPLVVVLWWVCCFFREPLVFTFILLISSLWFLFLIWWLEKMVEILVSDRVLISNMMIRNLKIEWIFFFLSIIFRIKNLFFRNSEIYSKIPSEKVFAIFRLVWILVANWSVCAGNFYQLNEFS